MISLTLPTDIPNVSVLATEPSTNQLEPVRHKVKHACSSCKERKVRCDGQSPCASCINARVKCEYVMNMKPLKKKRKVSFIRSNLSKNELKGGSSVISSQNAQGVDYKKVFHSLFPDVDLSQSNLCTESLISIVKSSNECPQTQVPSSRRKLILPPKQIALTLISKSWDSACLLFRFYHRPTFINVVESLYTVKNFEYSEKQKRFLPLVYSCLLYTSRCV